MAKCVVCEKQVPKDVIYSVDCGPGNTFYTQANSYETNICSENCARVFKQKRIEQGKRCGKITKTVEIV